MAEKLTKESRGGEDGGVIEKISKEMVKGLSNAFLASASSSDESSNNIEKEASQVGLLVFIPSGPFISWQSIEIFPFLSQYWHFALKPVSNVVAMSC